MDIYLTKNYYFRWPIFYFNIISNPYSQLVVHFRFYKFFWYFIIFKKRKFNLKRFNLTENYFKSYYWQARKRLIKIKIKKYIN